MEDNQIDLIELLKSCKQYIKQIVMIVVVSLIVMAGYTFILCDKVYQSDSTVMVGLAQDYVIHEDPANGSAGQKFTAQDIEYWVSTYSTAIKSINVTEPLSEQMGYDVDSDQITLTQLNDTQFLKLSVTADDPNKAQEINETVAPIFKEYISSLYKIDNLAVVEPASYSNKAVSPSIPKNMLMGLLVGCVIAAAYVVMKYLMDTRIKSIDDIKEITGLPVLAVVPLSEDLEDGEESGKRQKKHKKGGE